MTNIQPPLITCCFPSRDLEIKVNVNLSLTCTLLWNIFYPRGKFNFLPTVLPIFFFSIQLGGRQGNLDLVLEHFFGPRGVLRSQGAQALYDSFMKTFFFADNSDKGKAATQRGKRSVKSEIDAFDKNVSIDRDVFFNNII